MDDLTPITVGEMQARRQNLKNADEAAAIKAAAELYGTRFPYELAAKRVISEATGPADATSLVAPDEVSITILGLEEGLSPEQIFSGIYGIIPPSTSFRVPNTPVQFFTSNDPPRFYHRDQFVPFGPPVHRLGINYHGDLRITPDRQAILLSGSEYAGYKSALSKAADVAFRTTPELAVQLALDILTDKTDPEASLQHVLRPTSQGGGKSYQAAFEAAWRILDPALLSYKAIHSCYDLRDLGIIAELGAAGLHRVQKILEDSGAFPAGPHRTLMLKAPPLSRVIPGFPRLQKAIKLLFPSLRLDQVVMRDYVCSYPRAIWDSGAFSFGIPEKCNDHADLECLCWVGPYLSEAMESKGNSPPNSKPALWRAYKECMEGVVDMLEPPPKPEVIEVMDGSPSDGVSDHHVDNRSYVPPSPERRRHPQVAKKTPGRKRPRRVSISDDSEGGGTAARIFFPPSSLSSLPSTISLRTPPPRPPLSAASPQNSIRMEQVPGRASAVVVPPARPTSVAVAPPAPFVSASSTSPVASQHKPAARALSKFPPQRPSMAVPPGASLVAEPTKGPSDAGTPPLALKQRLFQHDQSVHAEFTGLVPPAVTSRLSLRDQSVQAGQYSSVSEAEQVLPPASSSSFRDQSVQARTPGVGGSVSASTTPTSNAPPPSLSTSHVSAPSSLPHSYSFDELLKNMKHMKDLHNKQRQRATQENTRAKGLDSEVGKLQDEVAGYRKKVDEQIDILTTLSEQVLTRGMEVEALREAKRKAEADLESTREGLTDLIQGRFNKRRREA